MSKKEPTIIDHAKHEDIKRSVSLNRYLYARSVALSILLGTSFEAMLAAALEESCEDLQITSKMPADGIDPVDQVQPMAAA